MRYLVFTRHLDGGLSPLQSPSPEALRAERAELAAAQLFVSPEEILSRASQLGRVELHDTDPSLTAFPAADYRAAYAELLCELHAQGENFPVGCR